MSSFCSREMCCSRIKWTHLRSLKYYWPLRNGAQSTSMGHRAQLFTYKLDMMDTHNNIRGSLQVPAPQQQAYEGCLHQDHQPHRNKYPKKIQKLAKCFIMIFLSEMPRSQFKYMHPTGQQILTLDKKVFSSCKKMLLFYV